MEIFILYLVIPERINFLQLGRYGRSCEQRFRQNFSKNFEWLEFNLSLSERVLTGGRKAITIDPSYISKSGKDTPWIGYFWPGTAEQAKRGLHQPSGCPDPRQSNAGKSGCLVVFFYRYQYERQRCHRVLSNTVSNRILFQGCQELYRTYTISYKGCCQAFFQL